MARWEIRGRENSIEVEAANWLEAVRHGMKDIGLDPDVVSRMVCDIQDDGIVRIQDPKTGAPLAVRALGDGEHADPRPLQGSPKLAGDVPAVKGVAPKIDDHHVAQAVPTEAPPDLAEQLFDKEMEIAEATSLEEASERALAILKSFVSAESGCVLYAGVNDTGLRFLAASGPASSDVKDVIVPFGQGIAGFSYDTGMSLVVQDASHDQRHYQGVDKKTGYHTASVLAASLQDLDGDIHGCLELINPPTRFEAWHLDAATTVAHSLAEFMRTHE